MSPATNTGNAVGNIGISVQIGTAGSTYPTTTSTSTSTSTAVFDATTQNVISQYILGVSGASTTSTRTAYPTPTVPSGPVPGTSPNTAIVTITNSQSSLPTGPINTPSAYDKNISALFTLLNTQTQTIANILDIIRQATANRDTAQKDITTYQSALDAANANLNAVNLQITSKESDNNNLNLAIKGASDAINLIQSRINGLNSAIFTETQRQNSISNDLANANANLKNLQNKADDLRKQIDDINGQINKTGSNCSTAQATIDTLSDNVTTLNAKLNATFAQINATDIDTADKNAQIAALQKQIDALIAGIAANRVSRSSLVNDTFSIPVQISSINQQIKTLSGSCSTADDWKKKLVDAQKNWDVLTPQIASVNLTIINTTNALNSIINNIKDLKSQIPPYEVQLNKTKDDLTYLKNQLPSLQNTLNQLYISGNSAVNTVNNAKANLAAASARFNTETTNLNVANANLEAARTAQAQTQLAVNDILTANTQALPYPIAPNATGFTNTLTNVNSISSVLNYIYSAYGSSVNTSLIPSIYQNGGGAILYIFGSSSIGGGSPCASTSASGVPVLSSQGTIVSVNADGSFVVKTSNTGSSETIAPSSCSVNVSNVPVYTPKIGDAVYFKGSY